MSAPEQTARRIVTSLEEALSLAPALDACAEEFAAQFSDDPYPQGASQRFLEAHFEHPATVLVKAEVAPGGAGGAGAPWTGLCLTGPWSDPLLGSHVPLILVLHVQSAWRHRGLGRGLLEEAARLLAERGQAGLSARVGHNDDALISMGERWGFVRNFESMQRD